MEWKRTAQERVVIRYIPTETEPISVGWQKENRYTVFMAIKLSESIRQMRKQPRLNMTSWQKDSITKMELLLPVENLPVTIYGLIETRMV